MSESPLRITLHRDPEDDGGMLFHRCQGCGHEAITTNDLPEPSIIHEDGCPRRRPR